MSSQEKVTEEFYNSSWEKQKRPNPSEQLPLTRSSSLRLRALTWYFQSGLKLFSISARVHEVISFLPSQPLPARGRWSKPIRRQTFRQLSLTLDGTFKVPVSSISSSLCPQLPDTAALQNPTGRSSRLLFRTLQLAFKPISPPHAGFSIMARSFKNQVGYTEREALVKTASEVSAARSSGDSVFQCSSEWNHMSFD